jgi:hypothetical protein
MTLEKNPYTDARHSFSKRRIYAQFPEIEGNSDDRVLPFIRYIDNCPDKHYSAKAKADYYRYLESILDSNPNLLSEILKKKSRELDLAYKYLFEINKNEFHDLPLPLDDLEKLLFVENNIHFNFIRVYEGIFTVFIYIIAHNERIKRSKKIEDLSNFSALLAELKNTQLDYLAHAVEKTVRNGIAHGDVTFLDKEIIYRDSSGNEERFSPTRITRMFDDLLDYINGMAFALWSFYLENQEFCHSNGIQLPRAILLEEVKSIAGTPRWEIVDLLSSAHFPDNKSQVTIYIKNRFLDYNHVLFFTLRTAKIIETYINGYDRYAFSLKSKYAKISNVGWAFFDGKKLERCRKSDSPTILDYHGALENGYVFYTPKYKFPELIRKAITFIDILRVTMPISLIDFRKRFFPRLVIPRVLSIHLSGFFSIIKGTLVLENNSGMSDDLFIRKNVRLIAKRAIKYARALPENTTYLRVAWLGFMRISIYSKDFRRRRILEGGLGPELICTIEQKRLRRIQAVDIYGGTIEQIGEYRIVWNSKWLQSRKAT